MNEELLSKDPLNKIISKSKGDSTIRYITFNVNGVKTIFNYHPWNQLKNNKDFNTLFNLLQADIITLQELKLTETSLQQQMSQLVHLSDYKSFISIPVTKKGYSGVGLFIRNPKSNENKKHRKHLTVIKAEEGITGWLPSSSSSSSSSANKIPYRESANNIGGYTDIEKLPGLHLDSEGRCVCVELADNTVIFAVYCPANSQCTYEGELFRLTFIKLLLQRCYNLVKLYPKKKIVIMGDINIAIDMIDHAETIELGIKENLLKPSFRGHNFEVLNYENCVSFRTATEARKLLNKYVIRSIWQDLKNEKNPNQKEREKEEPFLYDTTRLVQGRRMKMYTVWNTLTNARQINHGSRIDLILFSDEKMVQRISNADIWPFLMGSDHCPVFTDCDMSDEDDDEDEDEDEDENEDGNKTGVDLIEQPKLSFEAKNHFKINKIRDITSFFGSKRQKLQ
ncbi:AP endonuclease 2 [Candida albicans SC5314]|nr:AP endonuclease 2 [Candida albicans SC5314]